MLAGRGSDRGGGVGVSQCILLQKVKLRSHKMMKETLISELFSSAVTKCRLIFVSAGNGWNGGSCIENV